MNPSPSGETDPLATPADPDAITAPNFGVQQMHREIIQEHNEPRDGFEPVPMWLLALFGGVLVWGGFYAGMNHGAFSAAIQDRPDPPQMAPLPPPVTLLTPATAAK